MDAASWMDLYTELKRANAGRNIDAFMLHNAYHGNLWNLNGQPLQTDRSGRTILRNTGRDGSSKNKPLVVNYLKGIVDDYVALLGELPDVKVPPPGPNPNDQRFADHVERFHYGVWHASYMQIQMKAVAWWNSVMGDTAGIVWPDFDRGHPVFRFSAPYMLYSVPDDIEPFMLSKAIVAERFPIRAVQEHYPHLNLSNSLAFTSDPGTSASSFLGSSPSQASSRADGAIEVLKCFDKNEVVTIIAGKQVGKSVHNMGFCNVVRIPNILIPLSHGHSDIEQVVGLAQHASFIAQAYEEYVLQDIYAPIVVEGLMEGKVPEDIDPMNPSAIIPVNVGGKVYRLVAGQGSTVVGQELSRTQAMIEYNTGVPQIRMEGQTRSGWTTGRGIDRAQGPYFSRTQYRTGILSFYLEQMNSMSVRMQTRLFPKRKFTMFGMKGKSGTAFKQQFETSELDDYTFNKVQYSMAMGMDPMQRMVFVRQGLTGDKPLFDRRWAIEFLGITDHPDEMLKRIDIDQEKVLQQQLALRQAATGGTPPAGAAETAANLEGGGSAAPASLVTGAAGAPAAPPPAGGPIAPAPTFAGSAGGAPIETNALDFGVNPATPPVAQPVAHNVGLTGSTLQQVTHVLSGLTFKGHVWIDQVGQRVRVTCEKLSDRKKAYEALDPLYGNKVTLRVDKTPPLKAQEVTGSPASPPTGAMTPAPQGA